MNRFATSGNMNTTMIYDNSGANWSISWNSGEIKMLEKKNPYVPQSIHVNQDEKIVVVKWSDGTETKVTCDDTDVFNVDAGFAQALKYKLVWWKE